jgi:hypothetical protein
MAQPPSIRRLRHFFIAPGAGKGFAAPPPFYIKARHPAWLFKNKKRVPRTPGVPPGVKS